MLHSAGEVRFDDGEKSNPSARVLNSTENFDTGGMTGFNMNWFQVSC